MRPSCALSILGLLTLLSLCTLARAQTQSGPIIPVTQASCARSGDRLYFASGSVITGPTNWTTIDQFIAMDLSSAWDAATPVWHTLRDGPKALYFPSAFSADGNTMVTFRSGVPANGDPASSWLYSVQTNQWSYSKITVPAPNFGGLVPVTDPTTGLVYVAGGYNSNNNQTLNQMMTYDFGTDSYTLTPMPSNGLIDNVSYQGVWWPKGKSILYFGGFVTGGTLNASQITQFVPSTNIWSTLTVKNAGPPPVAEFCMAIADDGSKIAVFGGKIVSAVNTWTGALWVLDMNTLTWTQGQPYSTQRTFPGCTIVGSSTFISWGGYNQAQTTSSSAIIYDLDTNTYLTSYTPPGSLTNQTSPLTQSSQGGSSGTKSSNSAPLIGGIVGGCAVVALFVGAFLLGRRRRRSSSITTSPPKEVASTNLPDDPYDKQQTETSYYKKPDDSASEIVWYQEHQKGHTEASQQVSDVSSPRAPQLYTYIPQSAPQGLPHLTQAPQHWSISGQGGSPQYPAFHNASQTIPGHLASPQVSNSVNLDY